MAVDARFLLAYSHASPNNANNGGAFALANAEGDVSHEFDLDLDAADAWPLINATKPEDDGAYGAGYSSDSSDSDDELLRSLGVDPLADYVSDTDDLEQHDGESTEDLIDRLMVKRRQRLHQRWAPARWARLRNRLAAFGMLASILEHVRAKRALDVLRVSGLIQDDVVCEVMRFVRDLSLTADERTKLLKKSGPGWRRARV